ncbi:hypothetical protein GCM10023094_00860 [Rhodococcus olei]|uniref:Uncharacterized protein n=1 Tax=Rhodococcus olei TaxID=2161675 RepID=A0ABP8NT54_9NOCA
MSVDNVAGCAHPLRAAVQLTEHQLRHDFVRPYRDVHILERVPVLREAGAPVPCLRGRIIVR